MSKVRRGALAAGVVLAAAATVAMPSPAAPAKARSSADHPHGPSPALRAMLREIDARRVKSDITTLAGFGTRHTLSSQTDPNARHRRGARLDLRPVPGLRRRVGRAHDRRASRASSSPRARAIPTR